MSTNKKRKADGDLDQLTSSSHPKSKRRRFHCKARLRFWWGDRVRLWHQLGSFVFFTENRPSAETPNSTSSQSHYSPLPSIYKPSSSSDTSPLWTSNDHFNASASSFQSDDESSPSLHGSESDGFRQMTTTAKYQPMHYNPAHQINAFDEQPAIKREPMPTLISTTPPKKRIKTEDLSALPTPPPSAGYSAAAAKMMVWPFLANRLACFPRCVLSRKKWVSISPSVSVVMPRLRRKSLKRVNKKGFAVWVTPSQISTIKALIGISTTIQ